MLYIELCPQNEAEVLTPAPMYVTWCGNKVFANNQGKMKSSRWPLLHHGYVFIKRGHLDPDKAHGETPCKNKGSDQSDTSRSQRTPEDCQHNTRSLEQILPESSEGTSPTLTLNLDIQPPDYERTNLCCQPPGL